MATSSEAEQAVELHSRISECAEQRQLVGEDGAVARVGQTAGVKESDAARQTSNGRLTVFLCSPL